MVVATSVLYNEISVGGSGGTGITIDPAPGNPYGTAGSNTTANDLATA